jgi:DtxR family transcriptional regulator, Mn-dependent transcriptional regulator
MTPTEENYIKAIYQLSEKGKKGVSTNDIAATTRTKAASVSDMLRKLGEKEVIEYRKYYGVHITEAGKKIALQLIRKQKLWEVFLVNNLNCTWEEVHNIADDLEHIRSQTLIEKLDAYLGYPKFDPFGDPIPDEFGEVKVRPRIPLNEMNVNAVGQIVAVKDNSAAFLRYMDKVGAYIGAKVKVTDKVEFDGSVEILVDNKKPIFMSRDVASNIMVME